MLGQYFYHQIFRKSIIAFGTVFNNITIKRKDPKRKGDPIESIKVPCQYGPIQKYLAIIAAEPDPRRQASQISLPRISFEIKGLNYDASRKLVPTQFSKTVPPTGKDAEGKPVQYSQFLPVPYNLDVELNIISKNQDDGLQILEQILPNFHPSLNVSIEVIDETQEERDIAIVLNGVGYTDDYEGDYSQRRTLLWTLNFTVKTYLFWSCGRSERHPQDHPGLQKQTLFVAQQNSVTLLKWNQLINHLSKETRSILPRMHTELLNSTRTFSLTTKISLG